jgi:hypothetical protein
MKPSSKQALHFAVWAILLLCVWLSKPKRIDRVWTVEGNQLLEIQLPFYSPHASESQQFEVELTAPVKKVSIHLVGWIRRLEIDSQDKFETRDYEQPKQGYTDLQMPADLGPGPHKLRLTVSYPPDKTFFDIKQAHGFTLIKVFTLGLWGIVAFAAARRCGYGPWTAWPVVLSGLLALQYLEVTTPWIRQHDVEGHREYIDYLGSVRELPAVQQGWETWQPPLYYCLAVLWRWLFSSLVDDDPFRLVQYLATILYLGTILLSLPVFKFLRLNTLEAGAALGILAFLPGNLMFAGRINNDTLLPLLGGAVLLATVKFSQTGERRWRWILAALLALTMATKGSSLAYVACALLIVLWSERRRLDWRQAILRTYFTASPVLFWICFWWVRNAVQTGDPLYVNASLPDYLRVNVPPWRRLLSFDFSAFVNSCQYYYGSHVRLSYPTALVTSLLFGEYGMDDFGFRYSRMLRLGCLGMLLVLVVGAVAPPRAELRPAWMTCICFAGFQTLITVAYAMQFPYSCNQNMRFFAQSFVPFALLWGLGVGRFWQGMGHPGRVALVIIGASFCLGLGEFYWRLLI